MVFFFFLSFYFFVFAFAADTWPFLITLLIHCISLEISGSKRRPPKIIFAKALRISVQRAEDYKFSGQKLNVIV